MFVWFAPFCGNSLVFHCLFISDRRLSFLSPTGNLLPVVAITIYVSDSPLFPVAGKVGKRAVFDIRRKGNPKTIGFWWKLPKRRLRQIQRGGFEEVSRFSRHNVAGNRPTRRCVLLHTLCCCWQKVCRRRHKRRRHPPKAKRIQTRQKARFPHRKRALQQLLFSSWYGSPPGTWDR